MKEETRIQLLEVTKELAQADETEKTAKKRKEVARSKFLKLATQAVQEERPLKKITELVPNIELVKDGLLSLEGIERWRLKNYPDYKLISTSPVTMQDATAIELEEDPELLKFTFVNDEVLKVFGRTTAETGAYFDAEGLYTEISSLYDGSVEEEVGEATLNLWESLLDSVEVKTIQTYTLDETHAQLVMSLQPDAVPVFQKYAHPGSLSAKLTPIRKAKEEDVE